MQTCDPTGVCTYVPRDPWGNLQKLYRQQPPQAINPKPRRENTNNFITRLLDLVFGWAVLAFFFSVPVLIIWLALDRRPAIEIGTEESQRLDAAVKRWRHVIFAVIFSFILIEAIGPYVMALTGYLFPKTGLPTCLLKIESLYVFFSVYLGNIVISSIIYNWEYIIIYMIIKNSLIVRWPDVKSVYFAASGALIGLSILYALVYVGIAGLYVDCPSPRDVGKAYFAVSIAISLVWFIAPILAAIGWFVGWLTLAVITFIERQD